MNIDRVAKGMTDQEGPQGWRGPSGPAFTARVMAPIYGRPRPDFTARVMSRIDEEPVARATGWAAQIFRPAFAALALLVLAAAVMFLRADSLVMPATPRAPRIAALPYARGPLGAPPLPLDRWAAPAAPRIRSSQAPQVAEVLPALPPIYTIAALDGPAGIAVKPIGPAAPVIAPLEGPAPLKVNEIKEKS